MSNGLDPDQDRHSVGPDLVPNCLTKVAASQENFVPSGLRHISESVQQVEIC